MQPIDMKPAIHALNSVPNTEEETLRLYCAELAARMNETLVPLGVSMAFILFDHDLCAAKSGFMGRPLPPKLVGYPPAVYMLFSMHAKKIVLDSVPENVRAEVEAAFDL